MEQSNFKPGDLVWFESGTEEYSLPGEILEVHEAAQIIIIESVIEGKRQSFTLEKGQGNLSFRESSENDEVDDLTQLLNVHESSILWNLRCRFYASKFYTFVGSILVSVNPYQMHPNLYGLETVKKYAGASLGQLPPHLFAIGQSAYSSLVNQRQNQAIVITGESGSGKTEANKLIVRYLSAIASVGWSNSAKVSEQVLEASSLLESFGNAKTTKNDNSSRFGKYLEIYFKSGSIIGAKITHYLLEKSRIVTQYREERNYHIFYELLSGLNAKEREKFGLLDANKYFYLNQGSSDCSPNGSCKEWTSLQSAMQVLGFSETECDGIIRILASILHIGNVYFQRKQLRHSVEGVDIGSDGAECKWASHLLEISSEDLIQLFKVKIKETRNDVICTPLTIDQALDARDAFAKALYSGLFNWIVSRLNSIIHKGGTHDAQRMTILDIYGFESLQENSFEQLCINYANESLQLYFNKHVFKMEQAEYAKERLEWDNLEWEDNLPVVHLLAKKPVGIFHLLDDESNFPRASDTSFLEKCHYNHALNDIYKRSRNGANEFGINHFGSTVVWYDVDGFLEKNRDPLQPEALELLFSSSLPIVQDIAKQLKIQREGKYLPKNSNTRFITIKPRTPTISARFCDSLQNLLTSMSKCNPWFIRCINPNPDKQAKKVDMICLLDQIRYMNLLATVRIRKLGYPVRLRFQHFVTRYRHLLKNTTRGTPYKDLCRQVLESQSQESSQDFQIGATRVFLRETLHRQLEFGRHDRLNRAAVVIQRNVRSVLGKRKNQRKENSALIIQKVYRGFIERKKYQNLKSGVIMAQSLYRGRKDRKEFNSIKHEQKQTIQIANEKVVKRQHAKMETHSINSLDVPAELAFIFQKDLEGANSDKQLLKVVGTIPGPPFTPELPADLDQFAFSKFCSVYCDGTQLHYRKDPISKPFLDRAAAKDKDFQDALSIFKLILRWIGDHSLDATKEKLLADYIAQKGISSKNLRDEIIIQLCNQLHGIDKAYSPRVWQLMSHCLSSFQPGTTLSKYLMKFVKENAPAPQNEMIMKKLLRGKQTSRFYPPTFLEWRASKQSDIAVRLSLPDGSQQTVAIDSWTTCEEAAALSLSMIPGFQSQGWTVVLDEMGTTTDACGLDFVLDLVGDREIYPGFPLYENKFRRFESRVVQSEERPSKLHTEIEPLKRPLIPPPAPPQQSKTKTTEVFMESVSYTESNAGKVYRKTSIDMLSRNSALNERYFDFEQSRSKSMDDLQETESKTTSRPDLETKKPINETGLSGSRLNDRYLSVEQNMKQFAPKFPKHGYGGKRTSSIHSSRNDRTEMLIRSSNMSDTSETPSLASHVRRVRVPSQASDVDQFLDDLFSPVLDGNLDELSDARSLAASIRGGGNSLEEFLDTIEISSDIGNLAEKDELSNLIKGGDDDFNEADTYQHQVQRAFLETAMEQNIRIQQQLMQQNEALQTLLYQQATDNGEVNVSPKIAKYSSEQKIRRDVHDGGNQPPPPPPPMPPPLVDTDPFQRPFMDPYGRAKTVRIGKWRWPPIESLGENPSDFIAFKLRQNQRKTTPQSQHHSNYNAFSSHEYIDNTDFEKVHDSDLKPSEKLRETIQAPKAVAPTKGHRSFDIGAERPGPTSVGKLKLSSEMRQRLEKVTAGHSVRSTKSNSSDANFDNVPLKLDESRKMMLEKQLNGGAHNLSVRNQVQKMEASKKQKPFMPLPSIPAPPPPIRPPSIPPPPPTQQQKDHVPSFVLRMERDTFGIKDINKESREKIGFDHFETMMDSNKRSRSQSRERETYGESTWDRSEVEGPPSNDEIYKSNIKDKYRKSESSQIERERESLLVYHPKPQDKARKSSPMDQATFKSHMHSQKEREKKRSLRESFDESEDIFNGEVSKPVPRPVLAAPMLRTQSDCLTYGTRVPWKLKVKKEVFAPNETIDAPITVNFIFTQIINDIRENSYRISQQEKKYALNFLKNHDINIESVNVVQVRNLAKHQLIEIARLWPLYFSRFFTVNGSPEYPDVSVLSVHQSGAYLVRKDSNMLSVSKPIPFEDLVNVTLLPRTAALQLSLSDGGRCILHVSNVATAHSFLQAFLHEFKKTNKLNGSTKANGVKSSIENIEGNNIELYKISESRNGKSDNIQEQRTEKSAMVNLPRLQQEASMHNTKKSSTAHMLASKQSLLEFASQHFRYEIMDESNKSRSEAVGAHESFLANVVRWQSYPLDAPLLRLPGDLNALALECFECIMRYCGDIPTDPNFSEVKCVYTVLMHCHKHLILRDEVYCQLMKQTTANRSSFPESAQRAWRLLSILAAYFGCSEALKPYLIDHLTSGTTDRRGTAAVCLTNLRKTARCGGRKNVPSVEEVTAVSAGRSARRQIYRLPGGAERVVNTRCSTVVADVISELCSLLGVETEAEQQEFSLYCIVQGDAFTMPLCSDEYILDVTTELLKTNQPFYLIFCRSLWHYPLKKGSSSTPLYVEVLFNQVAPDYLEGLLLEIPSNGAPNLDYIKDMARIAAILHRAADLNHVPVMKEIKFLLPKPALGLRELKPTQWVNLVQAEFGKVLMMTPLQCKAEFLNVLSLWPLFGSSFFAVKRVFGDDIGMPENESGLVVRELILALNRRGVLFLDSNTHETLHHWHFIEVISTRKVRSEDALYLDLKVGNLLQQNVIRVQTEQAHEISRIIRQYISMASKKDD